MLRIMKKTLYFVAGLIALAGCAKEIDNAAIDTPQGVTVTIQTAVDQTKSTESAAVFSWASDETISVGTSSGYVTFDIADASEGTFSHTFSGDAPSLIAAVSPAQTGTFESAANYDVSLPDAYDDYVPGTTNALMIGTPDGNVANKFIFRHAAALLKVTYANVPVGTQYFEFGANENMAGGTVKLTSTSDIEIKNTNSALTANSVLIGLASPVSTPNQSLTFYVPVATGDYTGVNVALYDDNMDEIAGSSKTLNKGLSLKRGDVLTFPTITLVQHFVKVTSSDDLMNGKYLIVYEGDGSTHKAVAFKGSLSTLDATENGVEVSIVNDMIVATDALKGNAFTISIDDGTIKSASNQYIGVSKNSNGLKQSDDATTYTNSFAIDNDENAVISAVFSSSNMTMRYNYASDQLRFRYFSSGQQPIALYLLNDGTATVPSTHKASAELSYSETAFNVPIEDKDNFSAPTLNNPYTLPITYSSSSDSVAEVDSSSGVVTIKAVGVATITASFAGNDTYKEGSASYTITVTSSASVANGTILWQEDFTGYGTNMPSSATGSHVYGGGTVTYVLTNGGSNTKLYNEAQAGGIAPELLIGKATGVYSINGIPTGNASHMTLIFKSNYGTRCSISSSTSGITVGTPTVSSGTVRVVLSVTGSVSSFDLAISDNDASNNVRVDNILLVAGDVQLLTMSAVSCTNSGDEYDSLSFSWAAVDNAIGYQVSIDGGSTFGSTISANSYTWTGLDKGTTYTLFVKAIGDGTSYLDSYAVSASGNTKSDTFSYTLSTVYSNNNSAYANNYDVTINGMSWNAPGNQNNTGFWRIGGNNLTNVERVITANEGIGGDVNTITIYTNGKSRDSITLNGITVKAYTDNKFSETGVVTFTTTDEITVPKSTEKNFTFTKSGSTSVNGYYFKIVFTVSNSSSSNGGVDLTSIVFSE